MHENVGAPLHQPNDHAVRGGQHRTVDDWMGIRVLGCAKSVGRSGEGGDQLLFLRQAKLAHPKDRWHRI
jgi:hypothetical protein